MRPANTSTLCLNMRADLDIRDVVKALNGTFSSVEWNNFWTGDQQRQDGEPTPRQIGNRWTEVDDRVQEGYDPELLSRTWIAQREASREALRRSIDEWIDSGRRKDGSEASRRRNLERAPLARSVAAQYWETSRITQETDSTLRLMPPSRQHFSFDYADWKVQRIIAVILASEWRLLIAKCRYKKCEHPYFLLDKAEAKRAYRDGMFCKPSHRRIVAAKRHLKGYRESVEDDLVEWAGEYLQKKKTPPGWQKDRTVKVNLALHLQDRYNKKTEAKSMSRVRESIRSNWVTRHWKEIEKRRKELQHEGTH